MTEEVSNAIAKLYSAISAASAPKPDPRGVIPKLLSIDQAAVALGVHRRTIERYIEFGRLPKIKIGRLTRVRMVDLEALLEDGSANKPW